MAISYKARVCDTCGGTSRYDDTTGVYECIYCGNTLPRSGRRLGDVSYIIDASVWTQEPNTYPCFTYQMLSQIEVYESDLKFLFLPCGRLDNDIIDSLKPITEYDLEGVVPTFHPIGSLSNVMREDVEVPGFTQEEALANAPAKQDDCFLIPSILGEGGDR